MPPSSPTLVYVHKKYQCRYFDISGRPLNPPCNQGQNCRFLHPSDPNWPGLKPYEKRMNTTPFSPRPLGLESRRKRSNTEISAWDKTKQSHLHGSEPRLERHFNPLISQSDLFLRRKVEGEDTAREGRSQSRRRANPDTEYNRDRNRDRERKRGRGSRSRNASPSSSRYHDMRGRLHQRSPGEIPKSKSQYSNDPGCMGNNSKALIESTSAQVVEKDYETIRGHGRTPEPHPSLSQGNFLANYKARATQVVGIFRQLAKLSNQVTQDTEVQAREERKVELYTELSSTLSKISATGTTSIMPNLADIILKNAERKQRVDDHFKSMAGLWEQAFEIFVVEISRVLNNQLEKTVKEIRQAGDSARSSHVLNSVETLKRHRSEASRSSSLMDDCKAKSSSLKGKEKEPECTRNSHTTQQEHKRRRYAAPSSSPDDSRPIGQQPVTEEIQQSVQDILSQMKQKIDEQAQSLQRLMKENHELKASLQGQIPSLQSSRFSFHPVAQSLSHGLSKGSMAHTP